MFDDLIIKTWITKHNFDQIFKTIFPMFVFSSIFLWAWAISYGETEEINFENQLDVYLERKDRVKYRFEAPIGKTTKATPRNQQFLKSKHRRTSLD